MVSLDFLNKKIILLIKKLEDHRDVIELVWELLQVKSDHIFIKKTNSLFFFPKNPYEVSKEDHNNHAWSIDKYGFGRENISRNCGQYS